MDDFKALRFPDLSMKFFPIFMWTRTEIEKAFPVGLAGREQAIKCLEHSYSMYDFYGKHIPHINEMGNLFEEMRQRGMYVVDTNSQSPKQYKQHRDKAFIYSATLSREEKSPIGLILDNDICKIGNVFVVGAEANLGRVFIHKLDDNYRWLFDIPKFKKACNFDKDGKTNRLSEIQTEAALKINAVNKKRLHDEIGIALFCEDALSQSHVGADFIKSGAGADLPTPEKLASTINRFKSNIKTRLPLCKLNVKKSIRAAELCYCTLLMEDNQPRKLEGTRFEIDDVNYPNLFGDMYIVQTAIYLGANIITKDNGVKKMASYADVKCCDELN